MTRVLLTTDSDEFEKLLQESFDQTLDGEVQRIHTGTDMSDVLGAVCPSLKAPEKLKVIEEYSAETGECQVCGEEMKREQSIIRCSHCSTPHHQECWDYLGGCSTFGCMRV